MPTLRNDRETIQASQVEGITRDLCISYNQLRRRFKQRLCHIEALLAKGDVTGLVRMMVEVYRLPPQLIRRIGYAAKIAQPTMIRLDVVGKDASLQSATMYFQDSRESLGKQDQYLLLHKVAHELAHVRLYYDRHRLRSSEFATDLLAVLVCGDATRFANSLCTLRYGGSMIYVEEYGYIRRELQPEVFRQLQQYEATIFL